VPTVFVYGTLTDPERARSVLASPPSSVAEARLSGLHRVDGRYPTLAPGGQVTGRLLRVDGFERLDRYEGVDSGLYVRVPVAREDDDPAWVYVGDPERLGVDVLWPGDGSLRERVVAYVEREDVVVDVL
jgi:gamma-glutamylcyclotransferase (GGCT)/AIG2-like uncharacterized protein YtfP